MTARERAIAWAAEVVADPSALVVDSETLGIDPCAGLCDLAIVSLNGTVVLDQLINPGRPIPAGATAVHGISDADVAGAPSFRDIYPDVAALLKGRRVITYNSAFDAAVLDCCCDEAELPGLGGADWQCAMKAYADYEGSMTTRRFNRNGRWIDERGPTWHKLGDACAAMGIVLDGAHRALADAEACRRLVVAMAGVCPVDTEDASQPDGSCVGCGGTWIMGRHFHPREIEDGLTAADELAAAVRDQGAGRPVQAGLPLGEAPGLRQPIGRDWTE